MWACRGCDTVNHVQRLLLLPARWDPSQQEVCRELARFDVRGPVGRLALEADGHQVAAGGLGHRGVANQATEARVVVRLGQVGGSCMTT